VSQETLTNLDELLWRRFGTPRSIDTPEQLLAKLAMASQEDTGTWCPTVAGVLMACRKPERFLPGAFIQAVAYQGSVVVPQAGSIYQRDARDITGPLDQQIFDACDFVRKNMRTAARKGQEGGREDLPQYDMLAIFEAVTNAVAYRDYSMAGSKIRLRLFDDRLELYTPGPFLNTMTPESLPYRQASRNEAVTSLLARCPVDRDEFATHRSHIMDRRGEGVPIILSRSEEIIREDTGIPPDRRIRAHADDLRDGWILKWIGSASSMNGIQRRDVSPTTFEAHGPGTFSSLGDGRGSSSGSRRCHAGPIRRNAGQPLRYSPPLRRGR